ncbi:hypothetical protein K505DRAFT_121321 [Melanomma pulvis-pyrius CBS 109.77]|uniref:Uncharacterized protein n=1 Tax=Melanomma pulvis-pyrius CBS 109.77 TaxID=1314802 RepID=A0A6A6XNJ5_9PLEO|nr:hypothetical protein K505DRAFT_121321 [Melanomma pulvis-pyrius CBS 109.77]
MIKFSPLPWLQDNDHDHDLTRFRVAIQTFIREEQVQTREIDRARETGMSEQVAKNNIRAISATSLSICSPQHAMQAESKEVSFPLQPTNWCTKSLLFSFALFKISTTRAILAAFTLSSLIGLHFTLPVDLQSQITHWSFHPPTNSTAHKWRNAHSGSILQSKEYCVESWR